VTWACTGAPASAELGSGRAAGGGLESEGAAEQPLDAGTHGEAERPLGETG
jgi:hypothetical protein